MRRVGVNAKAAPKGPDSVNYGIQRYRTTRSSILLNVQTLNMKSKLLLGKDRLGKPTNKPNHEFSHCMDAMRYGLVELKDTAKTVTEANLRLLRQGRRRF